MKKLITVVAALTAFSVFSATQTSKEYVDAQDGELHDEITAHKENGSNPHGVTAAQVDAYSKDEADEKFVSEEADPTVPEWAKMPEPPRPDVSSVNLKTGDVTLDANDVGAYSKEETDAAIASATPGDYVNVSNKAYSAVQEETDPNVPEWAKRVNPPEETDPTVPEWAKRPDPPQAPSKIALGSITNKWGNPIVIRDIADNAEFNWQRVTTYESTTWTFNCLAYANGMFMIDNGFECQYSKDGEKWESFRHNLNGYGLFAAKEKFYIASWNLSLGNGLYVREDGTNWIKIVEGRVRGLKEVNGHVLIGNENKIMVSDDGINFRDTNQREGSFNTFAYKDGIYMAGERSNQVTDPLAGVYVSQDLMNWEKIDTAIVDVWGGDDIVFGTSDSSNRRVHYTTNGVDWIDAGWRMGSQSQVIGCIDGKIIYARNGFTYRADRNGNSEVIAQNTEFPNMLAYSREKDRCVMASGDDVYLSKKNAVVQQIRVNGKLIENDKNNVADIEIPTPGNYASVSNRAMNAIQYGEVEPPGDYANVSNKAMTAMQPANTYNKDETDALIAANKPEYEDLASNVVWRIEADGARFFFKPVRPVHTED